VGINDEDDDEMVEPIFTFAFVEDKDEEEEEEALIGLFNTFDKIEAASGLAVATLLFAFITGFKARPRGFMNASASE